MKFFQRLFGSNKQYPKNDNQEQRNADAIKEKLLAQLEPFKKTAYIPKTEKVESAFNTASKIGGLPYLAHSSDWPVCPNCKQPMQLFVQLNCNDLPVNTTEGLIQLFYCTTEEPLCEADCDAYSAFSKSVVCRRIQIESDSVQVTPCNNNLFDEKRIVEWLPVSDYPHYDELEGLGFDIDINEYEILENEQIGVPLAGDKLFGWPYWVQSVEYPFDRKTGAQMNLVFQLDSEVNLPYMFGDSGVGHLTQSPDDPNELAFAWACC